MSSREQQDRYFITISSSNRGRSSRFMGFFGLGGFVSFLLCQLLLLPSTILATELASQTQTYSTNEVMCLLAFRRLSVQSDPNNFLSTWKADSSSTLCSWYGVSCSSDGHVTAVNLSNVGLVGGLHLPNLTALPRLRTLYLQGNSFSASDLSASSSCALETIDLSSNNISGSLPLISFIVSCRRLNYVNLSRNSIIGGTLRFGPSLLQLDLSRNRILDFSLLKSSLSSCQNLQLLNFSDNKLAGKLGVTPLSCTSLSVLDLSYNILSGEIPPSFVADSPPSLKYLDLSHNNLSSKFSSLDFGTCVNLTFFSLSQNSISGSDFPASLRNCKLMDTLDLSRNMLQGKIPGEMLGGFQNLRVILLSHNQFSGDIPPELGHGCGKLQELDLSVNKLTGGLPETFIGCSSLQLLNLGNNLLAGDFLSSVVSSIRGLRFLYVPFNNIVGPVPMSLANCTQLQVLDLSSNEFTGKVPSWFCSNPTSSALEKILLANNYLSGSVPSELGRCRNLRSIDLSFNSLTGPVPREIWTLPNLSDLVMWANNLTGKIPEGICVNGGNLETLILNNNLITGKIPQSIGNCTNMIWVSLSSNRLSGEIPAGIGNLVKLAILQMGNNSLSGHIPQEIGNCKSLIWLDLNSNDLSGPLPSDLADNSGLIVPGAVSGKQFVFVRNEGGTSCRGAGGLVEFEGIWAQRLENFPMVHSCPSTRIYSGKTVYTFTSNGTMIYLDLSYNSLSGPIPEKFGSMTYVQVLNLGHNRLTGNIPNSFGGLKEIGVLDLSHNNLQGFVPGSLGTLSFLSDLDVSNNNLTGPYPYWSSRSRPTSFKARRKQPVESGMVIGIAFFVICILGLTLVLYRVKKNQKEEEKREKYIESLPTSGSSSWKLSSVPEPLSINIATFEKPLRKLTFAHLLEATNAFSANSLIGSGGFGEVYKARLRDDSVVAIKKLINVTGQGDREFVAEMETIGKIKHRNLVPLLGYCKIGEERLLVYEYMKWGSLESVLHDRAKGGVLSLDWAARKKIAIGSARGTPGYVPPEYYQSFRCTTKGDVYSYGVILLELLSGKRPIDPSEFGDDNNLVGWAKQLHKENRSNEILDTELENRRFW
ncbi:hypothetical protein HS088_TW18G01167 [Tripterygium wilfordii]|uniref:non-specific serine/threonine protein kinase n=1 Tax=Tripterygium wilfordii TaxID=458696 RepID=A0A7J7CEE0_TRIWF|nr:hypothetical protein HS088_TW18G01167 [Tripterygium wilfordii]